MSSAWQGGTSNWQNPFTGENHTYTAFKGIGGAGANSTVGTMFFGSISGGAAAAVSGGNFWQGAVTGMVVSGLNHSLHYVIKLSPNSALARQISNKYGYEYEEVVNFLDSNPFELTHEGVKFLEYEAKSSKFGGGKVQNFIANKGAKEIGGLILKKIFGKGAGFLLSSGKLGDGTRIDSPENKANRILEAQNRLIEHVFSKPYEYQTPSMLNGMQSKKYHSSIYDRKMYRFY